jgi:hypothetical protein
MQIARIYQRRGDTSGTLSAPGMKKGSDLLLFNDNVTLIGQ